MKDLYPDYPDRPTYDPFLGIFKSQATGIAYAEAVLRRGGKEVCFHPRLTDEYALCNIAERACLERLLVNPRLERIDFPTTRAYHDWLRREVVDNGFMLSVTSERKEKDQ